MRRAALALILFVAFVASFVPPSRDQASSAASPRTLTRSAKRAPRATSSDPSTAVPPLGSTPIVTGPRVRAAGAGGPGGTIGPGDGAPIGATAGGALGGVHVAGDRRASSASSWKNTTLTGT